MATSTAGKTQSAQSNSSQSAVSSAFEAGKEYLDSAIGAAQRNPWTTAAIGVGVAAAATAAGYGATKLVQRSRAGAADGDGSAIDPASIPEPVSLQ